MSRSCNHTHALRRKRKDGLVNYYKANNGRRQFRIREMALRISHDDLPCSIGCSQRGSARILGIGKPRYPAAHEESAGRFRTDVFIYGRAERPIRKPHVLQSGLRPTANGQGSSCHSGAGRERQGERAPFHVAGRHHGASQRSGPMRGGRWWRIGESTYVDG
jgi:hypothetical protein